MEDKDDAVATFVSLSGLDAERARQVLAANGWNLEFCTNCVLEGKQPGSDGSFDSMETDSALGFSGFGTGGMGGGGGSRTSNSSGGSMSGSKRKQPDEGEARKIAEVVSITGCEPDSAQNALEASGYDVAFCVNEYLSGRTELFEGNGGMGGGGGLEDDVRAPILAKNDVLAGNMGNLRSNYGVTRGGNSFQAPRAVFQVDPFADFKGARDKKGAEKRQRLAEMFKPPLDLIYQGDFNEARAFAKAQGKMVIVNIQKNDEFASQALNRDLWNRDEVKEVVQDYFVFWQQEESTLSGKQFLSWYPTSSLPCICLIDARTGERVQHFEGQVKRDSFVNILKLHRNLALGLSESEVEEEDEEEGGSSTMLTEEEMLKRAMAESMGMTVEELEKVQNENSTTTTSTTTTSGGSDAMDEQETSGEGGGGSGDATDAMDEEETEGAGGSEWQVPTPDVDEDRERDCTVMLQMPSGDRLEGQFNKEDPLAVVHNHVQAHMGEEFTPFELMQRFPKKVYGMEDMESTLKELDLDGAMLAVRPLEE